MFGERPNLVAPLPERRQGDADDVQPEEEILAELSVLYRGLEVPVGRGDHAHVDAHILPSAQPRELAVLEHLQQLRLQWRPHLADLVEEHRAVVRELELARLVLDRPGEGAALEAEQLRLEQLGRQRRAIDFDEGPAASRRSGMNAARHQLLSGAALTTDEHGHVGVGDAVDELTHFSHLLAGAEQLAVKLVGRLRVRLDRRRRFRLAHLTQTRLTRALHELPVQQGRCHDSKSLEMLGNSPGGPVESDEVGIALPLVKR